MPGGWYPKNWIIPFSKWLITMVGKPPNWGCGTPSKWPKSMAPINGGDPNHLLSGMILQVSPVGIQKNKLKS